MIDRLPTVVVGRIRTVAVPDTLDLADRGAKEVSRPAPGRLLGPEAGDHPGVDDLAGGQLQTDSQTPGSRLRPAWGSTAVPGRRDREVNGARKTKLEQVCALCRRK